MTVDLKKCPLHLVMDVESVGLHGDGFAVGYVVLDRQRATPEVESGLIWTRPENGRASGNGREWVKENVRLQGEPTHQTLFELRNHFWERVWMPWKNRGAALWGDTIWPVEARFLAACVDDALAAREWQGPYPLLDIATLYVDRLRPERAAELAVHNPLHDSRYSGICLLERPEEAEDDPQVPAFKPPTIKTTISRVRVAFPGDGSPQEIWATRLMAKHPEALNEYERRALQLLAVGADLDEPLTFAAHDLEIAKRSVERTAKGGLPSGFGEPCPS